MPATNAISGKGTQLGYADTAVASPTNLGELKLTNTPEITVDSADATHYESPDDHEEKISIGWRKVGDQPATLNYHKTMTATLYSLFDVKKFWTETLPDGSTWEYEGWISKLGGDPIPNKDVFSQSIVITITGKPTFTAAA